LRNGTVLDIGWRERAERIINLSMMVVALVALVSLILEYGQYVPSQYRHILQLTDVGIILIFIAETFVKLIIAKRRWEHFKRHLVHFIVIALLGLQLVAIWGGPGPTLFRGYVESMTPAKLSVVIIQAVIGFRLLLEGVEAQRRLARVRVKPAVTIVGSFVLIIAIGTALLYSPRSVPPESGETHVSFVDAVFTATSSVCVTGLVVRDTGPEFSRFGQGVILVLIQIGGLGLMTFAAFFALLLGRGLQLPDSMLMRDMLNEDMLSRVGRTILAILAITFTCEAVGAALLYPIWPGEMSVGERVYVSVFHAVSAFCNAGFSLFPESFTQYVGNWRLNVVIMGLIVVGGIGFAVQANLLACLKNWLLGLAGKRSRFSLVRSGRPRPRLSLQSRIVLVTTALLIVGGALGVWLLARDGQLMENGQPMGVGKSILASLFQSVTARTAGFNTLETGALSTATLLLLMFLMFVGASPGSTGGGIKTSTFAMLALYVRAAVRRRDEVEVFRRTIPRGIITRVMVVLVLAMGVVTVSVMALAVTERNNAWLAQGGERFMQILFESISAFGTVGLSTGLTRHLTSAGKVVIVVTMLVGRIGQLALLASMGQQRIRQAFSYPEERLMVG